MWTVDLNSFEIEADTHEEAVERAEKALKEDVTLAFPMNVFKTEGDDNV